MSKEIEQAIQALKSAIKEDDSYAISWHANLAMAFSDAIDSNDGVMTNHWAANDGARRFMKQLFDVDTSKFMPNE